MIIIFIVSYLRLTFIDHFFKCTLLFVIIPQGGTIYPRLNQGLQDYGEFLFHLCECI